MARLGGVKSAVAHVGRLRRPRVAGVPFSWRLVRNLELIVLVVAHSRISAVPTRDGAQNPAGRPSMRACPCHSQGQLVYKIQGFPVTSYKNYKFTSYKKQEKGKRVATKTVSHAS